MPNQRETFSVEKDGFFGAYSTNPNGVDWCMIALLGGKEGKSGERKWKQTILGQMGWII